MQWTRGLAQMCQLLEHHKREDFANLARKIPFLVVGAAELDEVYMKQRSSEVKYSTCSLPRCQKNDFKLTNKFQICTRCKVAKYCSREHQAEHWKAHKRECKKRKVKKKHFN